MRYTTCSAPPVRVAVNTSFSFEHLNSRQIIQNKFTRSFVLARLAEHLRLQKTVDTEAKESKNKRNWAKLVSLIL